jgi:hypothetical protein
MAVARTQSPEFGMLQQVVDALFESSRTVTQIALIVAAENADLCSDLVEVCKLVPAGAYNRQKLCDQINAAINGHGWGFVYGTVE